MLFTKVLLAAMATMAAATSMGANDNFGVEVVECCGDGYMTGCCEGGYQCGCPRCPCKKGETPQYVAESVSTNKYILSHDGAGDFGLRDNPKWDIDA